MSASQAAGEDAGAKQLAADAVNLPVATDAVSVPRAADTVTIPRAADAAVVPQTRMKDPQPTRNLAAERDRLGKRKRVERLAVRYFKRRAGMAVRPQPGDAVHYLNPAERQTLRRIERNAVLRAAAAGAFAATLGALVSIFARPLLGDEPAEADWGHWLRYTGITLLTALPVAIVELGFIYWNAIISVHRLAEAAGVVLFRAEDGSSSADSEDEIFAAVLARAALEIPNPPRPMFGIDPRREASRFRLVLATIVYKAKVSVSNFVLRKLLVRAFGRAGLRSWIPFVAVPITATWDAFVCRRALREARLRAIGPSAAHEVIECLVAQTDEVSPALREALFRAIAVAVVGSSDFHPNLVELIDALRERVGDCEAEHLDDSVRALALMRELAPRQRRIAIQMLAVACVFDGRIGRKEWGLLGRGYALLERATPRLAVLAFKRSLLSGDGFGVPQLVALVPDLP
ncbi:MAG: hypothetical protein H0T76_08255 [Nannocystis sp.]|nr:hypothetical protein [Nannocystis sp.]MBA3546458.1 hypothetical protein [Nannocystis sp.]